MLFLSSCGTTARRPPLYLIEASRTGAPSGRTRPRLPRVAACATLAPAHAPACADQRERRPMRIIDITAPLGPRTPVYPGDPAIVVAPLSTADGVDRFALSRLTLGTHAGTHVDPPSHLFSGGATVDNLPLDVLIGPAQLVDLVRGRPVTAGDLEAVPRRTVRLLLRTGGAPLREGAARALVARGVRLIGVDGLSVD